MSVIRDYLCTADCSTSLLSSINLLVNFIRNPTPSGDPLSWKPVTLDEFTYLNISGRNMKLDVNPDSDRIQFWEKAYEEYTALQD